MFNNKLKFRCIVECRILEEVGLANNALGANGDSD